MKNTLVQGNLHCLKYFVPKKKLHYCKFYTVQNYTVQGIAVLQDFMKDSNPGGLSAQQLHAKLQWSVVVIVCKLSECFRDWKVLSLLI